MARNHRAACLVQQHGAYGVAFIHGLLPHEEEVLAAVALHHERWDGRGYPNWVAGPATPLLGRIMQIADTVSAMMLDRPYRCGLSGPTVIETLRVGAGSKFDPALVEPFIYAVEVLGRFRQGLMAEVEAARQTDAPPPASSGADTTADRGGNR